jgi:hypothetical protein
MKSLNSNRLSTVLVYREPLTVAMITCASMSTAAPQAILLRSRCRNGERARLVSTRQ